MYEISIDTAWCVISNNYMLIFIPLHFDLIGDPLVDGTCIFHLFDLYISISRSLFQIFKVDHYVIIVTTLTLASG
jgi:hypothetical protein